MQVEIDDAGEERRARGQVCKVFNNLQLAIEPE